MRKSMRTILALLMAALLALSTGAAAEAAFTPGTYQASAKGMAGDVTLATTFDENSILSIEVISQNETPSIGGPVLEKLPAQIVAEQSLNVDTVTGATMTSNAILDAVRQCVEMAGADPETLMARQETTAAELEQKELETDVVIIGAGGAGLSAAVAAAENGVRVTVVEKMASVGGTTALSSGLVQVAGTAQQEAAGITGDSWEVFANDIYTRGSEQGNREIIEYICKNANDTADWLAQHGINWNPEIQQKHGEDVTYLRTIAPVAPEGFSGALGGVFTQTLSEEAEKLGAVILLNTKADHILTGENGAEGIHAVNQEENVEYTIRAKAVIIATGGFAANSQMAHEYDPDFPADNTDFRAFPGSLGEGIVMGEEAGADVVDMQYMKILLSSAGPAAKVADAIYVNEQGERFVAEDAKGEVLAAAINRQTNSHCYMIYDSRTVGEVTEQVQKMLDDGTLYSAETIEELAQKLGMDAQNLRAAVDGLNAAAKGEQTDAFGREKFGNTIEEGPFYATERHTRLHYTMGGLKIDAGAHVLDTQGQMIPGLYAAGETTGGIHGTYRVGAYALTDILVMGRTAGANAAETAK